MNLNKLKRLYPNASNDFYRKNSDADCAGARAVNWNAIAGPVWEDYRETKSVHTTAKKFGTTGETVRRLLIKSGHKLLRSSWSNSEDEIIKTTLHMTAAEVAVKLGRSKASVDLRRSRLGRNIPVTNSTSKTIPCKHCGIEFVSFDGGNYCSTDCYGKSDEAVEKLRAAAIRKRIPFPNDLICLTCGGIFSRTSKTPTKRFCSQKCAQSDYDVSKQRVLTARANPTAKKTGHTSCKKGWAKVGNQKVFFRSLWEENYARYLQWMIDRGEIAKWEHEPETFWFEGIKRGTRSYLPDFRVTKNDGSVEYHEVKGWMNPESLTKLNRMRIYHPEVVMVVIDSKRYKAMAKTLSKIVPGWSTSRPNGVGQKGEFQFKFQLP